MNRAESFFLRQEKMHLARQAKQGAIERSKDDHAELIPLALVTATAVILCVKAIEGMGR